MQVYLFTDSNTAQAFQTRSKAFQYVDKQGLVNWMVLTKYGKENGSLNGQVSVFNPFIIQGDSSGGVEYFETEKQAMTYIGSFI